MEILNVTLISPFNNFYYNNYRIYDGIIAEI